MNREKITCLIVDDQKKFRAFLASLLLNNFPEVEILGEASSAGEAYSELQKLRPDVVFLDVEMGSATGFDLVSTLKKDEELPLVIFVTGHSSYAIDAIKVSAFDYLLKPVDLLELHKTVSKIKKKLEEVDIIEEFQPIEANADVMSSKLSVSVSDGTEFISFGEIVFFRAQRNYTDIVLKSGKTVVASKTLKVFEELLPKKYFFKTHRSFIVNVLEIKAYKSTDGGYIVMSNDEHANLSSSNKEKLFKYLEDLGRSKV